ncbi:hypothetical protein EVJ58_g2011 [Rhodofomes roseus]|uniref:Uncharacterized protein n=1 Tax=Rhodofomes roseus TaxID=34475 RepID=A0A4Y9YV13_9APHY|nr:hypothetical protein EVJ58_g2011 [Rhodofomes roseus]
MGSGRSDSDIEADEPSPEQPDIPRDGLRRRRLQIRGYNVDTDEDVASGSEACSPYAVTPGDEYFPPNIDTWDPTGTSAAADGSTESLHRARAQVPSDIPLHNGQHPTAPTRLSWRTRMSFLRQSISWLGNGISWCGASVSNLGEMALNQVTPYAELYEAQQADGHDVYDKVHTRLLKEWYAVAATLVALGGIDAATFGLAPDSIFPVDGLARHVVALGAITAGLGLFHDCVLLFSYSNINGERFRTMAQDVNGSYVTFSLHCRIPFVCMLISTMSLTVFLLSVAWSEWPDAVLAMSFLSGVLFSMQYLVYGCSRVPTLLRGRRRAVPDAAS